MKTDIAEMDTRVDTAPFEPWDDPVPDYDDSLPPLRWTPIRLLAVGLLVLLLGAMGAGVAAARAPVYESSSAVLVQQPELLRDRGLGVLIKLNQLRQHYTALL